jgi:hypothetical protein
MPRESIANPSISLSKSVSPAPVEARIKPAASLIFKPVLYPSAHGFVVRQTPSGGERADGSGLRLEPPGRDGSADDFGPFRRQNFGGRRLAPGYSARRAPAAQTLAAVSNSSSHFVSLKAHTRRKTERGLLISHLFVPRSDTEFSTPSDFDKGVSGGKSLSLLMPRI